MAGFDEYEDFSVTAQPDGKHDVVDRRGVVGAAGFASNAAAWSWIDHHSLEGRDDTDRVNRIRHSPSFS